MSQIYDKIDKYLIAIFNKILATEEKTMPALSYVDVSIGEDRAIATIASFGVERGRPDKVKCIFYAKLTDKGRNCYKMYQKFYKRMVADFVRDIEKNSTNTLMIGLENFYNFLEAEK